MKIQLRLPVFVALLGCLFLPPTSATSQPATIAFVEVNVLPMDSNRVLPNRTVLVQGDRITAVGPADDVRVPEGAERIPGAGRFLMPGLAEMHGHNPPLGSSSEYVEAVYFLFVANGVTTVRSMLGWPGQLELRSRVAGGELTGPTLLLAGPSFSGSSIQSPDQAERRVREQKAEGWDLLKIHPGLKRDHYDAMARTAKEAGIRFAGHVPANVGIVHALESGQETIDHLDGYLEHLRGDRGPLDPDQLARVVSLTRERNAGVVPTMVLWETIIGAADLDRMLAFPELKYMPASQVAQWKESYERRIGSTGFDAAVARRIADNRRVLLKALHDGGVRILFGTDAPQQFSVPGFSVHREMKAMAEAGLTNFDILLSATRNVGEQLAASDRFGTVTAGSRADLLLLEGNPLLDLGHVANRVGVVVRGRWLPESEIQSRLEKIAARSAAN
ncbi:MAG TPA: amidohydrolase [Verrucomicrobiales bacterium]|nr:amidohydrolase [Verrucomicrobiales bacterium]